MWDAVPYFHKWIFKYFHQYFHYCAVFSLKKNCCYSWFSCSIIALCYWVLVATWRCKSGLLNFPTKTFVINYMFLCIHVSSLRYTETYMALSWIKINVNSLLHTDANWHQAICGNLTGNDVDAYNWGLKF